MNQEPRSEISHRPVETLEKNNQVHQEIIDLLGGEQTYYETLVSVDYWARIGDNVWGVALWLYLHEKNLPIKEAEDLYQTYSNKIFQNRIAEENGILDDCLQAQPNSFNQRTGSEALEAIFGRLCVDHPDHKIPTTLIGHMIDALPEKDKRVNRDPLTNFRYDYPEYHTKLVKSTHDTWIFTISDPYGNVISSFEDKKQSNVNRQQNQVITEAREKISTSFQ